MAPSPKVAARTEAAVWLARLRSEARTKADESGFQDWLAANTYHRQAFDAATAVFEAAGAMDYPEHEPLVTKQDADRTRRKILAGAGATALVALGSVGMLRWTMSPSLKTQIGEQRRVALADGSKVILDTNSLIKVAFTDDHRRIELLKGRAHFEVAKDPCPLCWWKGAWLSNLRRRLWRRRRARSLANPWRQAIG